MPAAEEPQDEKSTRMFVSGLPPKFTSEQLRNHVAEKFEVTDAHVITERRIGFVGFTSHDVAKDAARYFDKTFIRMSKIAANLARAVEVKRNSDGHAAPVSNKDVRNQKRILKQVNPAPSPSKRRKIEGPEKTETPVKTHKIVPDVQQQVQSAENETPRDIETTQNDITRVEEPATDSDWLRGRTNRLLDLMEPEETSALEDGMEVDVDARLAEPYTPLEELEPNSTSDAPPPEIANARLFVRNLPFNVEETAVREKFEVHGKISDIHLVKDTKTLTGKGLGFVQFVDAENAQRAMLALDGKDFQGRLMHILPASDKKTKHLSEFEISKLPLKQQKALKRKGDAAVSTFNWNSLYMNPDAVLASVADRLGISRNEVLDPTSAGAAVKQAHAETSVIAETKEYLRQNGVNVDSFKARQRDDQTLLLKNFPFGVTADEITAILGPFGKVEKVILPPTGTMAIVKYDEPSSALRALKSLAYSNIRGAVLYLEKAPKGILDVRPPEDRATANASQPGVDDDQNVEIDHGTTTAVFVRNLNFATSSARLAEVFRPLSGFLSARVKTRTDPNKPGQVLSMGFGFVEFRTQIQAEAALSVINGHRLDGHELSVQLSHKAGDSAEQQRQETRSKKQNAQKTKIIIKNLPFEVSKKDVRALFSAYGQLRTVRVPRKFDNSTRGFAFAEFITPKEAQTAMEALSNTHLLGRRLVLEFAEGEMVDPEDEIRALEKKVGHQQDLVQLKKMAGPGRRKFNVETRDELESAR